MSLARPTRRESDLVNRSVSRFGVLGYVGQVAKELSPKERLRVALMFVAIAALHIIGFAVFIAVRSPVALQGPGNLASPGWRIRSGLRHASTPTTFRRSTTRRGS